VSLKKFHEYFCLHRSEALHWQYKALANASSSLSDKNPPCLFLKICVLKFNISPFQKCNADISPGATGVETAGELGFEFGKDKEITLVRLHFSDRTKYLILTMPRSQMVPNFSSESPPMWQPSPKTSSRSCMSRQSRRLRSCQSTQVLPTRPSLPSPTATN
jgi:hypothetical protein